MWFRRKSEKVETPSPEPEYQSEGRVFFETIRGPQEPLPETTPEQVLDLRPAGEREPKRVSHYYDDIDEGVFYEAIPQMATREWPFVYSPIRTRNRLERVELSELVAVLAVLGTLLVIGVALAYSAVR